MSGTTLQADQQVTITLAATDWNTVLGALHEAPFRVAAPVIQRMMGQIEQHSQPPPAAKPNGSAEVARA